jgi:membrane-bound serine protease (ClpP class)
MLFNTIWRFKLLVFLHITSLGALVLPCNAAENPDSTQVTVLTVDLKEEITPGAARMVQKALNFGQEMGADLVLIHMNTYGGLLDAADSIRTRLLNYPKPVIVFIDNNAASAGALISLACDSIYMREGANIGAATVVNQEAEALPDKYQSYMRSMMRSTAEANGRDPRIAEAMVDERIAIPGVNDSGKVLTLTAREATALNFCEGTGETIEEVLGLYGVRNYSLLRYEVSWVDRLIGWLIHPAVSGVLILLMLGGLYYEVQQPGIGLPLLIAVAAALLYFAPLYLEGLAANWEILLAALGIVLIGVEVFILPGFGVAGIGGIALLLTGLVTSMLRNDGLDFSGISSVAIASALASTLGGMAGALLLFLVTSRMLSKSPAFRKLVLDTALDSAQGFSTAIPMPAPGTKGIVLTVMRPSGKVHIDGTAYSASSESGFLENGIEVEVVSVMGGTLIVRPVD